MRAKPLTLPAVFTALALGLGAVAAAPASAATAPVNLGTVAAFGVLGASTVTNTGPTLVGGNLGLSPGTAVTGFPPGQVTGAIHIADAVALQAQSDTTTAYNSAAGRPSDATISADLAGQTLQPGVYSGTTLALNGTLTLDGANDPNAVFIFQSASSLITGPNSSVVLVRGANACNVFWQVGSSATLGVGTSFQGTVAALTSITAQTAATLTGRLLARNGAVTLDTNTISRPMCTQAVAPSQPAPSSPAAAPSSAAPSPTAPAATASASPAAGAPTASATPAPSSTPAPAASASPAPTAAPAGPAPTTPGASNAPAVPAAPAGPAVPAVPAAPASPAAPAENVPEGPAEQTPPADLTGGTTGGSTSTFTSTSTSTQAGPFLPSTGGHAGQLVQLGLLALLLGGMLSLTGHRPPAARR